MTSEFGTIIKITFSVNCNYATIFKNTYLNLIKTFEMKTNVFENNIINLKEITLAAFLK